MESVVLQDLSIGYTTKGHQRIVANHLRAALQCGELTCLLGRNGVGKSTLLRTLAGFLPALEGDVLLDGKPMASLSDKELSYLIGIVLTEKPHVRNMTVEEMVAMGRAPYTGFWGKLEQEDREIVQKAILQTDIESLRHRQIQTLSDGERQKVMIAKALAQQTPIIYLDEPTAFLDFPSKVEMMQLLRRLAREEHKTIFLSTHDVELTLQLADCIWLMEPDLLHVGTPKQLAGQGVLNHFIEHNGIRFDNDTLTIHLIA